MLSIPIALNSLVSVPLITEGLQEYFKAFGEVTDCIVMHDPVSKRSRYWHFERQSFLNIIYDDAYDLYEDRYRHVDDVISIFCVSILISKTSRFHAV